MDWAIAVEPRTKLAYISFVVLPDAAILNKTKIVLDVDVGVIDTLNPVTSTKDVLVVENESVLITDCT